ncbi:MAG: VWA domain-containing protein [Gammaproteobacteria bacterium]
MIQLAYPWALLSLLSIPLILVLYSLRPSRRTVVVSSTSLWREAIRERKQGLGLQKLLSDLGLLALLLFALAMSLGLSGPSLITRSADRNDAVLVVDVSASMQTAGTGGTRFDAAKQRAIGLIRDLPDGARMLLMTSGRAPALRSAFESESETLLRQLERIEPTDEAGQPREALALALSMLRDRETGRVYFVTDGAFDDDLDFGTSNIEVLRVGEPARNVAITRFDVRPEVGAGDRFQVLLTVRNYTDEEMVVPASVTLDRKTLLERDLRLGPGARRTLVLPLEGKASGEARARIELSDDLRADNQAFAVLGTEEALAVLLFSKGNYYLESAFSALPNVNLTRLDTVREDDLARQARIHDVVIFDGVAPPALAPGNYLLIDAVAPGLPFEIAGSVAHPAIEGKGASALVRNVDLSGVRIDEAKRIVPGDGATGVQRLFWSEQTTLALAWLQGGVRAVFLGFDLSRSTFPLQAAFPLFLDESLSWLRPRTNRFARTQLAAGEIHTISVPEANNELIMRMPSGDAAIFELQDGALAFNDTSAAGIYRYTVGEVRRYFAVNLTDERESDVSQRAALPDPRAATVTSATQGQITLALWPYLVAVALGLLVLEWALWSSGRSFA